MHRSTFAVLGLGGTLACVGLAIGQSVSSSPNPTPGATIERHVAIDLGGSPARVGAYERDGRIVRLYGEAFSHGDTPQASAEAFVLGHAGQFGVEAADLLPVGPFDDGRHTQPMMYDADTGQYKFTGVYYTQVRDGVPVYGSRLTLLVRNEADHGLVLAAADLRNLGEFRPNLGPLDLNPGFGVTSALKFAPSLVNFTEPELVVWAGVNDMFVAPTLAYAFVADNGEPAGEPPMKYEFITDAQTGEVIHLEDKILFVDVTGNVSGRATQGLGAEQCGEELPENLPYARVNIGGVIAFADVNGDFVIPNGGSSPVTVESRLWGTYFRVYNNAGADELLSLSVTPPGPANFLHNEDNTSEQVRAQVNGYLQANAVRDFVLTYNPSYPVIASQTNFPVYVNRNDGYCPCNAWYNGDSINFCLAGGGCPNTAWGGVIHHEYGHHLVQSGGSGQGQYGEGMSDSVDVVINDDPGLGYGFFGGCFDPLRTADNSIQYPCSGGIHECGQLLSGCIWDTRNELLITEPFSYRDIIASLTVNSILLHTGTEITPSITIDFLTLDDDDGNILNGTPHYAEIDTGFSAHNMDAPPLALLGFSFPDGLPEVISPQGGTTIRVEVEGIVGTPEPGSGSLVYTVGGIPTTVSMIEIEPNVYDAVFPAIECGSSVSYYFFAETTTGGVQFWPTGVPAEQFATVAASDLVIAYETNFQAHAGWTVTGTALDGQWDFGTPVDCNRGDPPADYDGSGACALTDNSAGADCNSDVDDGYTYLISPTIDLSAGDAQVSFALWYTNNYGNDPNNDLFKIWVSNNNGASWTHVETVGPVTSEGWNLHAFQVGDYVTPTATVKVRFEASDLGDGSVVEAGVDAFIVSAVVCDETCPEDVNGDMVVDVLDLLAVIGAWGNPTGPEDVNGDGTVDVLDLLAVISAWGECP